MRDPHGQIRRKPKLVLRLAARLERVVRNCPWTNAAVLLISINGGYALLFQDIVIRHRLCGELRCVGTGPKDPIGLLVLLVYGAISLGSNVSMFGKCDTLRGAPIDSDEARLLMEAAATEV
jgi:hypothetical protein